MQKNKIGVVFPYLILRIVIPPLGLERSNCAAIRTKKLLFTTTLAMLFFSFLIGSAQAANWYVRAGATGSNNGSNWTNAWQDFDRITGVAAGDTVWIAGGTYRASLVPATSGTAESRIYYKRVRSTDSVPVAATGWSAGYDSQVVLSGGQISFSSFNSGIHHVTIDGQIDSGIKVTAADSDFGAGVVINNASDNSITIEYIDMAGQAGDTPYTFSNDASSLYINNSANLTIRYCRIHGSVNLIKMGTITNGVFEYTKLYNNLVANPAAWHPNMITSFGTSTVTFRYNETYNWYVEGIMLWGGVQSWTIYGNLWHDPYGGAGVNRVLEAQEKAHTVYFYNNTVSGAWVAIRTANAGSYSASSNAINNIYWNITSIGGIGANDDYNFSNTTISGAHSISNGSNPFVGSGVYRIVSTVGGIYPRNKGTNLGSPYNPDMWGVTRGTDGAWDIGASEFPPDGKIPVPPAVMQIQ